MWSHAFVQQNRAGTRVNELILPNFNFTFICFLYVLGIYLWDCETHIIFVGLTENSWGLTCLVLSSYLYCKPRLLPFVKACVICWAKTRHIEHFMKIEMRLEIDILMCNSAAGKTWKQLVAWFLSYRAKCVVNVERNFSRKRNVFMLLRLFPYTIVSHKYTRVLVKKQLEIWQRQLGKTAVVKVEAYIVSMDRKTTIYLKLVKSHFLKNVYKLSIATHSRINLLTCMWVWAYVVVTVRRAGLHNSAWYSASTLWRVGAIIWV